ncbi:uncharacterized protein LOC106181515 [Lingula anatina]|uniref:Uncharacterized protein LOC106181515 n=1 Tax=Lingula anatina TaxID=7574 RepID=A0A1S3KFV1_LINAN|nr:uncharacterized protein LOC106181515 [Lingula anatina]|eukprot:XP_013421367.1 uncharacterized protein LOC106181515 [Lingula anatina]
MATATRHILTGFLIMTAGGILLWMYMFNISGHYDYKAVKTLYARKAVSIEANKYGGAISQTKNASSRIKVPAVPNNSTGARYVVYMCQHLCGGWGDRLRGIMSTFAWSVLNGRQFIIEHTWPCDLRKFLQPKPPLRWADNIPQRKGMTTRRFNLIDNNSFLQEIQKTKNLSDTFHENVLRFHTNGDMFPGFRYNKDLHKTIRQRYGVGFKEFTFEKMFKRQYDTIFEMTPYFSEMFQSILSEAKPTIKSKLACLQFRQLFQANNTQKNAWAFLKNITSSFQSYKIFVTTDSEEIRKEAKEIFGSVIVDPAGAIGNIDHAPRAQREHNCHLLEKTLLDWHLLTQCDVLLHSRSGYGQQASMMKEPFTDIYALAFNGTITKLQKPDFKQPGGYMDTLFRNMTEKYQ